MTLTQSTIKLPRLQALDPRDPMAIQRGFKQIEDYCRQATQQINLTTNTLSSAGLAPTFATILEAGIMAGSLLNVGPAGARLAICTDSTRFCTDIATFVSGTTVTCYPVGNWNVLSLPIVDATSKVLYLSGTYGYATDVEPTTEGYISQVIGMRKTDRSAAALCGISFSPRQQAFY